MLEQSFGVEVWVFYCLFVCVFPRRETRYQEGRIRSHYPEGGIRSHYPEGRIRSHFPEGRIRSHYPEGMIRSHYLEGRIISHYLEGRIIPHYPEGRIRSHYPEGMIRSHYPEYTATFASMSQARIWIFNTIRQALSVFNFNCLRRGELWLVVLMLLVELLTIMA